MSSEVFRKALFPLVIIAALVWLAVQTLGDGGENNKKFLFSQMLEQVRQDPERVRSVTFHPASQEVEFHYADGTKAKAAYPVDQSAFELQQVLESKDIVFDAKSTGESPWWSILTSLLPFVLLFGFWLFLMRNVRGQTPKGSDPSSSF
jgi:cell division protease FtsH